MEKTYYQKNKEKLKKRANERYKSNKEEILSQSKDYRELNREKIQERKKKYYEENKEEILMKNKKYRNEHRKEILEKSKKWRKENPEKWKKIIRKSKEKNKEHIKLKGYAFCYLRAIMLKEIGKCENCGISKEKVTLEVHHEDYSNKNKVKLLCKKCHTLEHLKRGVKV